MKRSRTTRDLQEVEDVAIEIRFVEESIEKITISLWVPDENPREPVVKRQQSDETSFDETPFDEIPKFNEMMNLICQ